MAQPFFGRSQDAQAPACFRSQRADIFSVHEEMSRRDGRLAGNDRQKLVLTVTGDAADPQRVVGGDDEASTYVGFLMADARLIAAALSPA